MTATSPRDAAAPALTRAAEPRLPWAWLTRRALLRLTGGFLVLAAFGIGMALVLTAMSPQWSAPAGESTSALSPRAESLDGGGVDAEVTAAVNEAVPPEGVPIAIAVAMLAKIWVVLPIIGLVGGVVWWRTRRTSAFWIPLAATLGGLALSIVVKFVVYRPRPPESVAAVEAVGPSFPSGHAIRAIACYGAFAWLAWAVTGRRAVRGAAWALALLLTGAIGVARVVEGAHWLSDIIASLVLGGGWLAVVLWASGLLVRRPRADATG